MPDLVPLHFDTSDVRMILRDGEPWWVLNDVCAILEISNPRHAATRLRDWQKGVANSDTLGGRQELTIVNEAGLYKLVLSSRKPVAEQFERWLTTEVLPSIRKFGIYPPPPVDQVEPHSWTDGLATPPGDRFREERLRWESVTGMRVADIPGFSPAIIRAIERTGGGIERGQRAIMLLRAGLDVLYILTGHRQVSPSERQLLDYVRRVGDPRQFNPLALGRAAD